MRRQFIFFLCVASSLLSYTAFKLHEAFSFPFWSMLVLMIPLFFLMFGGTLWARAHRDISIKKWFQIFSGIGSFFIGLWGTFIILSLISDLIQFVIFGLFNLLDSSGLYSGRLLQIFNHIHFYSLPVAALLALLGFLEVLRGPHVKKIHLVRKNTPEDLVNFKIAQISDLHIGVSIRSSYVNKVIEKTNQLQPDLIVITGDLIDGEPQALQNVIDKLSQLKSKYGVYYVVGNHEYYWGIEAVLHSLKNTGLHILMNENKVISIHQTKLFIAGVTDPAARGMYPLHAPDLDKASQGINSADFKILLAHQPGIYTQAEKLKYDLQFSGHTHAGQFFPFSLFIGWAHKYHRGLYLHDEMHVYVNPGTGYWGPAHRLGVPAEISLIELKQK